MTIQEVFVFLFLVAFKYNNRVFILRREHFNTVYHHYVET